MMPEGKRKNYDNLVINSLEELPFKETTDYKTLRNELIVVRYYYYAVLLRKRYDDCLSALSQEFFLSPITISRTIQKKLGYLRSLQERQIAQAALRKKYPWLVWSH